MLNLKYKNSVLGYFKFYYEVIQNRIYTYIFLNILIGIFDGIGLSLFIPLLLLNNSTKQINQSQSKFIEELVSFMHSFNIKLSTLTILIFILAIFSIKGFIRFLQMFYLAKMKHLFITKIQTNLVNGVSGLTYKGFTELEAGRVQNNLTNEVNKLYITMTYYYNCIQHSSMLLTYMILSLITNLNISFSLIALSAISLSIYKAIFKKTKTTSISISEQGNSFNGHLIQAITNFKYLKATDYLKKYANSLIGIIKKTELMNLKMGKQYAVTEGIKEPIAILIICLIIFLQTEIFRQSLDSIMICLLLMYRCLIQFTLLQSSWLSFLQNIGSMNSISQINNEIKQNQEKINKNKLVSVEDIEIINSSVCFSNKLILSGINMKIEKKSLIAFVGRSGAGKTTLANLVMGLFPPTKGEIKINNVNLEELCISDYRRNFGYISQDTVVFNDSIYNNVTFFDIPNKENKKKFWQIIEMVSLSNFIQDLSEKENAILGDNGLLISGGQKQRIAIARELYKNPSIIILDEATSALDSSTESLIKESIDRLKGQKTIIIIAHRMSTIKNADTIYLLDQKKIITSGTFNQLLISSKLFREMVENQAI